MVIQRMPQLKEQGRPSQNTEFFRKLFKLSGLNQSEFARRCGYLPPDVNNYLSGKHVPTDATLRVFVQRVFLADLTVLP